MDPSKPSPKRELRPKPPKWSSPLWFLPLMLLMLWAWQSTLNQFSYRTISYSEFKEYLARHEVVSCVIRQDDCMSDTVGLVRCAHRQNGKYVPGIDGTFQRDCSEQTAQEIDEEVKKILSQAYVEAKEILEAHREQLELVTNELLKNETLDQRAFNRLLGRSAEEDKERPGHPAETGDARTGFGARC